jgi:F-type H+-transporting ATPase subunit epsilon
MSGELTVEIADWEGQVWQGQGSFFTAQTVEGSIGVYPRHEPLLAILQEGQVKVEIPGKEDVVVQVAGGFLSVDSDRITVVADEAALI